MKPKLILGLALVLSSDLFGRPLTINFETNS